MRTKFFVCDAMAGRQCCLRCCLLSEEADSTGSHQAPDNRLCPLVITSYLPKNLNLMTANDDRSLLSVPKL